MNDLGVYVLENLSSAKERNTLHPHKLSLTTTWNSPITRWILFCFSNAINPVFTKQTQGHFLVQMSAAIMILMTTFKLRLKSKRCSNGSHIRFDHEKLKHPEITQLFQSNVVSKFEALNILNSDINTFGNHSKELLLTTAKEVLGKWRRKIQP